VLFVCNLTQIILSFIYITRPIPLQFIFWPYIIEVSFNYGKATAIEINFTIKILLLYIQEINNYVITIMNRDYCSNTLP